MHEPKENWIRDGSLSTYYFHAGPEDVQVVRVDETTKVVNIAEILAKLGLSEKEAFQSQRSSMLYYLRKKTGAD